MRQEVVDGKYEEEGGRRDVIVVAACFALSAVARPADWRSQLELSPETRLPSPPLPTPP